MKKTKKDLQDGIDLLLRSIDEQRTKHDEAIAKLTAELAEERKSHELYKKLWRKCEDRQDKLTKEHRERVEKHRDALVTCVRAFIQINDLVVDARFDESKVMENLAKTRELVRTTITKEMLDLVQPAMPLSVEMLLAIGALTVASLATWAIAKSSFAAPPPAPASPTS